jgi:hypothetical protein
MVRTPEGKRTLGRSRRRWEESIKNILKRQREWGCGLDLCGVSG